MDAAQVQPSTTPVLVGPGLSVAAQVANQRNPENPTSVVDKAFLHEVGVKTKGWMVNRATWWREHSTWVWGGLVGLDGFLPIIAPSVPVKYIAAMSIAMATVQKILSWRAQANVAIARVKEEIKRNPDQ